MDARVDGKVIVVTGGSRGIGQVTAIEFLNSGAKGVVVTSRKPDNIERSVAEIIAATDRPDAILGVVAAVDDVAAAERAIVQTIEHFGSCNVLVNNAGTNPAAGPLADVNLGAVDKTWSVNQKGPMIWAQMAWHQWMSEHGGVIINVASVGGLLVGPMIGAYGISKAALAHMTKQLAFEMAPTVRVNAVAPGVVKTKLSSMLWENDEEAVANMHPLKRLGEPEDVANAIVFLASDKATWLSGVVLPVDGGVVGAAAAL